MVVVMRHVNDSSNTPDHLAMTLHKKELRLGMLKEGVLTRIEKRLALYEQRRHPLTIMLVHLPGKSNKGFGVLGL